MLLSRDEISLIIRVLYWFSFVTQVSSQCTFGSTFASTTWHDNTKGTLTFTTTEMSGWEFKSIRDGGISTIEEWQCLNHVDDTYLVLRTKSTFLFQTVSTTKAVYGYLCLRLRRVTAFSFIYYQSQVQEINLGGERIKVSDESALTQTDVCDTGVNVPTTEYHVLVKSGSEDSAAIQCPDSLLFRADYTYISNTGQRSCTGAADTWDVCSNKKRMTFNYNSCSQQIAFSANGAFYCVANVGSNGYDYTTIYNRDATISAATSRFACLSFGGNSASVAPGNCTAFQTPFSFPLEADQQTRVGHRLTVNTIYDDCGPAESSSGLSPGAIAGIVISVLFVVWVWTMWVTILLIVLYVAFRVFMLVLLELSGVTDYIPSKVKVKMGSPVLSITDDIEAEKAKAVLDSISVTTPTNVLLNGKAGNSNPLIHKGAENKQKNE